MKSINFKAETTGTVEEVVTRLVEALGVEGFGVLTRIDLHSKLKEKLGKDIAPVIILGACNPELAFEAYSANSDVASLLPCNAVVRSIGTGRVSVELAKPSALMEILGDEKLQQLAKAADQRLERVAEVFRSTGARAAL
jgi:uncharacterized protein (DUF302 family)